MVVFTHTTFYARERLDPTLPIWHFGEAGVDIFFVISGVVMGVTAPAFIGRADGWKSFAVRRLIRIAPIYWIATTVKIITIVAIPSALLNSQLAPGHTALSYLFLPTTNAAGRNEPVLGVGWTLIFEMFFYSVFALALLVRVKPLHLCGAVMSAMTIGSIFRQDDWPAVSMYLNQIVLYFVVGIVIATWLLERDTRSALRWGVWITFLWVLVGTVNTTDGIGWELLARHAWVVLLVAVMALNESRIGSRVPAPVVYLGNASYSLYLFHPLLAPLVPATLAAIGLGSVPLSIGLSVVGVCLAAALIYRFLEQPLIRFLTKRVPYVETRPATVGTDGNSPRHP